MTLVPSILFAAMALSAAPQFEGEAVERSADRRQLIALDANRVDARNGQGSRFAGRRRLAGRFREATAAGPAAAESVGRTGRRIVALRSAYAVPHGPRGLRPPSARRSICPPKASLVVRFQPAAAAVLAQWDRLLKMKAPADLLAVEKKEVLDYHKGTIHDVTDKQIEFEMEGELSAVNRLKVFGLIYREAERERSEPVAWIADAGGWRWAVRSMTLRPAVRVDHRRRGDRRPPDRAGGADRPVAGKGRLPQRS